MSAISIAEADALREPPAWPPKRELMGATVSFGCSGVDVTRFLAYVREHPSRVSDWASETAGKEDDCFTSYLVEPFTKAKEAGEMPRDALVLGYNPASVRKALDGAPSRLGSEGGLLVDLGRFDEADALLALAAAAGLEGLGAPPPPAPASISRSPWKRLHADGAARDDRLRLRLRLEPRSDA